MPIKLAPRCVLAIAVLLMSLIASVPVNAQVILCGERAALIDALKTKFREDRQAMGVSGTGSVIELFVSQAGTWTMLITSPQGRTCVMAAGNSWDGKTTVALGTAI